MQRLSQSETVRHREEGRKEERSIASLSDPTDTSVWAGICPQRWGEHWIYQQESGGLETKTYCPTLLIDLFLKKQYITMFYLLCSDHAAFYVHGYVFLSGLDHCSWRLRSQLLWRRVFLPPERPHERHQPRHCTDTGKTSPHTFTTLCIFFTQCKRSSKSPQARFMW